MKKDTGGPAFPRPGDFNPQYGMTLRDYFAAKALQGLLADPKPFVKQEWEETIADTYAYEAYVYADAMLKAREI